MFVLIVMLVVFFTVAISSWWLEDFAVAEDEQTVTKSALMPNSQPSVAPHNQLSACRQLATTSN